MKTTLIAFTLALSAAPASAEGVLNLYNWGNYTSAELLAKFEKDTGIKVTVTDYDSNDTALAKIEAGGHGFDLVVPSAPYIKVYADKGLIVPLDHARLKNIGNIDPQWVGVEWDKGREYSIPWQWGTTGMGVNTKVYGGDINTSAIFLDPPPELVGKVNVVPEMSDVMALTMMYLGADPCTENKEELKKARDLLLAAKPKWLSMDYGATERLGNGDWAASVNWNGSNVRARIANPDVKYGYPKEGYPIFMDSVALLKDAKNVDNAYIFLDYIMVPQHAAMISAFAKYANGINGSEEFMPDDMRSAPEVMVPEEFRAAGRFATMCSDTANQYRTAIWTELQK